MADEIVDYTKAGHQLEPELKVIDVGDVPMIATAKAVERPLPEKEQGNPS